MMLKVCVLDENKEVLFRGGSIKGLSDLKCEVGVIRDLNKFCVMYDQDAGENIEMKSDKDFSAAREFMTGQYMFVSLVKKARVNWRCPYCGRLNERVDYCFTCD